MLKKDNKWYDLANFKPSWSNLINAGMLITSFFVMKSAFDSEETQKDSNKSAGRSAFAAEKSVDRQDIGNDISKDQYLLAKDQYLLAKESYLKTISLNEKSLDAQIKSIQAAQNQFQIGNEPFLEIRDTELQDSIDHYNIRYKLYNLGNYPVKILESKIGYGESTNNIDYRKAMKFARTNRGKVGLYVIKDAPSYYGLRVDHPIPNSVKEGSQKVYLYGEIKYSNKSNNQSKFYRFYIEINSRNLERQYYINDNSIK